MRLRIAQPADVPLNRLGFTANGDWQPGPLAPLPEVRQHASWSHVVLADLKPSAARMTSDSPRDLPLPKIPIYHVGASFPMAIARRTGRRGYELLQAATANVPPRVLRVVDRLSRSWLDRNRSPYLTEIDALAEKSHAVGLYYLNVSYEFGCTTAAIPAPSGGAALLQRTLDWNVNGIGQHVVAARIANPLGQWISLTWPAYTGVIQALAPGRFAAAINQPAPASRTGLLTVDRWLAMLPSVNSSNVQPIHLLRRVFETAADFATARTMLETTPITAPAIFTLAGIRADEAVVIERKATAFQVIGDACAANEWQHPDWQPRQHKAFENDARRAAMRTASREWDPEFGWLVWPLLNDETRLAMLAEPATGRLMVRGYEGGKVATQTLMIEPRQRQSHVHSAAPLTHD